MENGSERAASTPYLSHFEISTSFAWRGSRPQEIEQRRALLDDLLIFDILLRSGGIRSPDILYPPHDEQSLVRLLDSIENSNYDALKKDCLVYFLLKWHQDGREEKFATQRCIAPQFAALADAYWHLDSGINVPHGISILADVRLNRDYASKILQAISLSPGSPNLIRKYVRTTKPPLTEPDDIELYTLALADSSLLEAWQFQRSFHESNEVRPRLLPKLFEWCVSPKLRPEALMQLLGLPLSPFEERILHSYVLKPPATLPLDALPILQDLVCVRLMQLGRYVETIRMDKEFSSSKVGTSVRQAQDRSKMVQDLYDALPVMQRTFIDAELAGSSQSSPRQKSGQKMPGEDVDMSQSWEEIHPVEPQPSTSKHTGLRPISARVNAPRFGGLPPTLPSNSAGPQMPTTLGKTVANPPPLRPTFSSPTLPTTFSSPSGSRPHQSLSNTAGRLALGTLPHVSSPLTGAKLPALGSTQPNKPAGNIFISANQLPNAFYTPPAKTNGHAQPAFPPRVQHSANGNVQKPSPEKTADDMCMEEPDAHKESDEEMNHHLEEPVPQPESKEEQQELGFSVFGKNISNVQKKPDAPQPSFGDSLSSSTKRKVPGSFGDDEDEDMEEAESRTPKRGASEKEPVSGLSARSRKSISEHSDTPRKKAKSKRTGSKEPKHRRGSSPHPSLPGGLGSDDALDEDYVAPLRSAKSLGRKSTVASSAQVVSRASTTSDFADELGDGVQTRRRSSRLTASGSGPNLTSGEGDISPTKKSTRVRKPTAKVASSSSKKKRAI